MRRFIGILVLLGLGCEQRADVGDPPTEVDAGPRDGSSNPGRPALELLAMGEIGDARAGFESGATAGDAFGACLTRTLGLVERPEVTQFFGAFGLPAGRAADLLGPRSVPSRFAATWVGSGRIELDGVTTTFDRARTRNFGGRAYRTAGPEALSFSDPSGVPSAPEPRDYRYDCTTGNLEGNELERLSISYSGGGRYCYQPTSVPTADCVPDGGRIEILAAGNRNGASYRLRFTNLLMSCSSQMVRANGEIDSTFQGDLDTTGLHPLMADLADGLESTTGGNAFGRTYLGALAAGTSAEQLLRPLFPLSAELDGAAGACERAAQASGVIFTVPGVVFGGDDLPVTAADAGVLAGLLSITSAALQIASAYQWPLPLAGLCTGSACLETTAAVDRFNANLPALTNPAVMSNARTRLATGLEQLAAGLSALSADSVIRRDATTAAGIERWRGWAMTAKSSVDQGSTALDGFTPAVGLDLARLFTAPPRPDQAGADPLVVELGSVKLVEAFYDEVLGPYVDVTADGSVGYSGPAEAEDLIQSVRQHLKAKGAILE